MDSSLLKLNRMPRKQKGQRVETANAFFLRYYITTDGGRKQKCVKLADRSELYRSWKDVEPLIEQEMARVNSDYDRLTGRTSLADFIDDHYLPWCEKNGAAATARGYKQLWERYLKPFVGSISLVNLTTAQVTGILTAHAKKAPAPSTKGLGRATLGHIKWFLSGVYGHAIANGIVPAGHNPVPAAKWLVKVARPEKQAEYSLETVLAMLKILEPLDLRAAVAVGLCYFAALRPAEIRGLQWTDYDGEQVNVRRGVWRNVIGATKTEDSADTVPVIEPLRSLLEKLRAESPDGFILQNSAGKPLSLDSLNYRIIAPAMEKAGIEWRGYYPGRRGISSLVTDTSKNALNSTGLLRHSTPITALKHYTRAQKDSIAAALKTVEEMATREPETVQ